MVPQELTDWFEQENGINNEPSFESDAALGRHAREQFQRFASSNQKGSDARHAEWQRWRNEGKRIQSGRVRKATKRELAVLIKRSLSLPDAVETIRKKI